MRLCLRAVPLHPLIDGRSAGCWPRQQALPVKRDIKGLGASAHVPTMLGVLTDWLHCASDPPCWVQPLGHWTRLLPLQMAQLQALQLPQI